MKNNQQDQEPEPLSTGVFELSGEPVIVINGVPDAPPCDGSLILCDTANTASDGSQRNTGFGKWLEGREVRKQFGNRFYTGRVTEFDKQSGWYRVVYEDGDVEDLDWVELEEVLLPLDISIPLKTLAMKIFKKNQKSRHRLGKALSCSRNPLMKRVGRKKKEIEAPKEVPLLTIDGAACEVIKNAES